MARRELYWTKQEAKEWLALMRGHPEAMDAYLNSDHSSHELAVELASRAFYWQDEAPPVAELEQMPDWDALPEDETPENVFGDLDPEEVERLLGEAFEKEGFREAYFDPEHVQHKQAVQEMADLMAAKHGTAPPGMSVQETTEAEVAKTVAEFAGEPEPGLNVTELDES